MRDFFAFRRMISAYVVQVIFVIGLVGIVIAFFGTVANDQPLAGVAILVFGTLWWRIICEVFVVLFRMNNTLTAIHANTAAMATGLPGASAPPLRAGAPAEMPAAVPAEGLPSPGWYDDSDRPGHKRWWDGTAWGIRDDEYSSGS